jgi:hypothetical protein
MPTVVNVCPVGELTMTVTCTHYVTCVVGDFPHEVSDPDGLLARCEPGALVTAVVNVTAPERQVIVREVYPTSFEVVRQLKHSGVRLWSAEDHAAWTDRGWLDIEALEGEAMPRPHP